MKRRPLPQIFVHNRQRKISIDRAGLRDFALWALPCVAQERGTGLTSLSEIDAILVSDRGIAELHRRFMGVPGPTDVITFQHGEIFISVETARRQAKGNGVSLGKELRLYLLHGLLHLQGFDDRTPSARAHMQAMQERIISAYPAHRFSPLSQRGMLSALELPKERPEVFLCLPKTLKESR